MIHPATLRPMRVKVEAAILRWARERAQVPYDSLLRRFPRLGDWEAGVAMPTLNQLQSFAKATHTPIGFFFLPQPPEERVPIPDFRTGRDALVERPSANLLDAIYDCEQRQEWYRDQVRGDGAAELSFVGSASTSDSVETVAERLRLALRCDVDERRRLPTWTDALRSLIDGAESLGILVMVSGVVGNSTKRKLDPAEFRGFALSDAFAPLIFINGSDSKAAQMFTLVHEAAHIWLGKSSLDNVDPRPEEHSEVETWCNEVAAETLVPHASLRELYRADEVIDDSLSRLARHFKVSSLVILRSLRETGLLSAGNYWAAYEREVERLSVLPTSSGGNFYATQATRVGRLFGTALVASTLEGRTLYRDALRLLRISKVRTFQDFGKSLGFDMSA
jgi:Zn-dependent peptidase ImmA (M78 family)